VRGRNRPLAANPAARFTTSAPHSSEFFRGFAADPIFLHVRVTGRRRNAGAFFEDRADTTGQLAGNE
jgi:hypothetical protein